MVESHSPRGTGRSTAVRMVIHEHWYLEDVALLEGGVRNSQMHWGSQDSGEVSVLPQTFVSDQLY